MDPIQILQQLPLPQNPAIIFDIDDTLIRSKDSSEMIHITKVYHYARSIDITPIIITARNDTEQSISFTQKELHSIGIKNVLTFFRPINEEDFWSYKKDIREYVHRHYGYNVIMSLGDNPWDIGEWGGIGVIVTSTSCYVSEPFLQNEVFQLMEERV